MLLFYGHCVCLQLDRQAYLLWMCKDCALSLSPVTHFPPGLAECRQDCGDAHQSVRPDMLQLQEARMDELLPSPSVFCELGRV